MFFSKMRNVTFLNECKLHSIYIRIPRPPHTLHSNENIYMLNLSLADAEDFCNTAATSNLLPVSKVLSLRITFCWQKHSWQNQDYTEDGRNNDE